MSFNSSKRLKSVNRIATELLYMHTFRPSSSSRTSVLENIQKAKVTKECVRDERMNVVTETEEE